MEVAHGLAPSPPVTPRVADISLLATRATSHAWCDKSHAWSHQPRVDGQLSLPRRDIRATRHAWPQNAKKGKKAQPRVVVTPRRGQAQPRVAFLGHAWHYYRSNVTASHAWSYIPRVEGQLLGSPELPELKPRLSHAWAGTETPRGALPCVCHTWS